MSLIVVFAIFLVVQGNLRGSLKDFFHSRPTKIRVEAPLSTNMAVELVGGLSEAESVAKKCGLVNRGEVNKTVRWLPFISTPSNVIQDSLAARFSFIELLLILMDPKR